MNSEIENSFIERWQSDANEKSDTQKFWLELLHEVLGLDNPGAFVDFEKRVEIEHVKFIDAYIPSTGIIIEQKSPGVDLDDAFVQAKKYYDWLSYGERGRYIVTCDFLTFRVHDMEYPKAPPEIITLQELAVSSRKLAFLISKRAASPRDIREEEISVRAGELVGRLHDSLLERYHDPKDGKAQHSLNIFCVRIVFLLYAEDAGLFEKAQFHDYLKPRQITARDALLKLFDVLSTDMEHRDPYLDADLAAFPHVNGGLFADRSIELPQIDGEPLRIILEEMSEGFDWSGISPTIFGAAFESTLNPETRGEGGMHYTSIENIHRAIDPLFFDELNAELDTILAMPKPKARKGKTDTTRRDKLLAFQKKLASLTFFDPACGSGNFLTESYLSLRRLENKILRELSGQITFAESQAETPIQVSISQFYGLEVNDFAVAVARTALWIAEAQMWNETKSIIQFYGEPLPLKDYDNIRDENALRTDWAAFVPHNGTLYIMSNPPFLGYSVRNNEQLKELQDLFRDKKGKSYGFAGKIDYVAGWYWKASEFMQDFPARAAFVSTNSITQGEQVTYVFKTLYERFGISIDFAHQPFKWNSEAEEQAQVHVVVIGFDTFKQEGRLRRLYTSRGLRLVDNINFYLVAAPNDFAEPRTNPISPCAPGMITGNRAADGGFLLLNDEEYHAVLKKDPRVAKFLKRYMMGYEFINNVPRYCLWLVDATPQEIHDIPFIRDRVKACREDRLKGAADRRKLADTPSLFRERRNPKRYLVIPKTSSEKREYIPIGWLDDSVIPGDGLRIIPDATLYDFGILTSRVHMGWMRRVTGRLKSDYSYSKTVVYNTFAWPSPSPEQKALIERTAQEILDARAKHPESSFAALYDDASMPADLRIAHRHNDAAVCGAYGWSEDMAEEDIVTELFGLYHELLDQAGGRRA